MTLLDQQAIASVSRVPEPPANEAHRASSYAFEVAGAWLANELCAPVGYMVVVAISEMAVGSPCSWTDNWHWRATACTTQVASITEEPSPRAVAAE